MNFFMLTTGCNIFSSLERYLSYTHHFRLQRIKFYPSDSHSTFIAEFNRIVEELEKKTNKLRNTVVFIDPQILHVGNSSSSYLLDELDPLNSSKGPAQLLSMLILATPEIHWVFLPGINLYGKNKVLKNKYFYTFDIDKLSNFIRNTIDFTNTGLISLFDSCNLRNSIREKIIEKEKGVPVRNECAAAIDEEISYALLNAYTAYRFGYRVWTVTTFEVMKHIFQNNNSNLKLDCDIKLVFEDLYLNFPDRNDEHLSDIEDRDDKFEGLANVNERILVTVGHKIGSDNKNKWQKNLSYLKFTFPGRSKVLYKPLSGIFDLWKKAGKWNWYKNTPKLQGDFTWPPKKITKLSDEGSGHSTPGRLLLIVQSLLKRSENILRKANSVEDTIQAATLALEAKELLACKTPTTAMKALSLQHQAEVETECMFYGVEYDFDVKSRIKDIKKEVKAISTWFHRSAKRRSQLNAEISILNELAQRYRNYSQFDEENVCINESRKLTNALWVNRNPLRWLIWPFRAYINFLLKSLNRFIFVMMLWVFLFGLLYWFIAAKQGADVEFIDSIIVSAKTFLAFQPPDLEFWVHPPRLEFTPIRLIYFIFPAVLGFIHLGVFISHLTMILMRKTGG